MLESMADGNNWAEGRGNRGVVTAGATVGKMREARLKTGPSNQIRKPWALARKSRGTKKAARRGAGRTRSLIRLIDG